MRKSVKPEEEKYKGIAVGIDLGTTNSCVAVYCNQDRVEVVKDQHGCKLIPSIVTFSDTEVLVGNDAKIGGDLSSSNCVMDIKRLMGKDLKDWSVQDDLKYLGFRLKPGKEGTPTILIEREGKLREYTAVQLSAIILEELKRITEAYIGKEVKRAVITVPAYFNSAQRKATSEAAEAAGFDVLKVLNEPTAASLAYGLDKSEKGDEEQRAKTVLVFDLGGGTLDISILDIDASIFEVRASYGNTRLGGHDFDKKLHDFCVQDFKRKQSIDLSSEPRALRRLRRACERAKIELSLNKEAVVEVDAILEGVDFSVSITRAQFETLCKDLFNEITETVERVVRSVKLTPELIDQVVLVGGSSRIPKIKADLQVMFQDKSLLSELDPDDSVARGAAVHAAGLTKISDRAAQMIVLDVTAHPLGIETAGGVFTPIVEANSIVPCRKSKVFTTFSDQQSAVMIKVLEGERLQARHPDNYLMGKISLKLPPKPLGIPQIEVTFFLDVSGMLHVTSKDLSTGKEESIELKREKGRLKEEESRRLRRRAEEVLPEDEYRCQKIDARNCLMAYAQSLRNMLTEDLSTEHMTRGISRSLLCLCHRIVLLCQISSKRCCASDKRDTLKKKVAETLKWLSQSDKIAEVEDLQEKQRSLEEVALPVMLDVYQAASMTQSSNHWEDPDQVR